MVLTLKLENRNQSIFQCRPFVNAFCLCGGVCACVAGRCDNVVISLLNDAYVSGEKRINDR